ncbi:hypothetical protein B9W68_12335 [Streptomyces sp. CS227]|uniref:hypothetical protein n=1 Tax=Streptomyces sp. CS227 TaxID=1982763 RepID=UPI000B4174C7|nr:hypothetical protein [Streptomyces sp. CS227]OWA12951.1 hypothetical protein B9W68_12335 [Streptomyces sp. CS227]
MNRRTSPALTALATATALLLTACGGESSEGDEKIPGAGESSAEASASPSEKGDAIVRPEMKFPNDFKMTWDVATPTDPDEAAAVNDARNYMEATFHAVTEQDPEDSAYKFYVVPLSQAQQYAKETAEGIVKRGWTVTGELRHSNVQVRKGDSKKLITVSFCQNESEAFSKEVKTGKVLKDQGSEKPYYAYSVLMEKSASIEGLWQAKAASATKGAAQCA